MRTDGELSELESALLDAHLGRCLSCATFAQGTEDVAGALRSARLERPAAFVLVPQRRGHVGVRALQLAAAVAVVAGAGIVAAFSGPSSANATGAKPVSMVAAVETPDRLRELRRPALIDQGRAIPRNRQVPDEVV